MLSALAVRVAMLSGALAIPVLPPFVTEADIIGLASPVPRQGREVAPSEDRVPLPAASPVDSGTIGSDTGTGSRPSHRG